MTATTLTFRPESHEYFLGDRKLPSVTQILKEAGLVPDYPDNGAAFRGTVAHEACAILNRGEELDEDSVDAGIEPYVTGYRKFLADMGGRLKIHQVEERVHHERRGYAGTLDLRGTLDNFPFIADIKCGSPAAFHRLQSAGYDACFLIPSKRFCIYLGDGGYSLVEHRDPSDRDAFFSALASLPLLAWKRRFMA